MTFRFTWAPFPLSSHGVVLRWALLDAVLRNPEFRELKGVLENPFNLCPAGDTYSLL